MFKFLALAAALFSANAFAYDGVLLKKTTRSGYTMPAYITSSTCEIYANKVVITSGTSTLQSKYIKPVLINGNLKAVINNAKAGPFEKIMAPVDGPVTIYTAVLANGDVLRNVDLLVDDGNGSKVTNKSDSATELRIFIDMNCGQ
ncbi:hypothetical protein ACUHMQ_18245 [Chitinimonas sp. PSY-7]|uniref:hypothetical protein n=1 Tax=Chitinimonas sp. PSY-7 TaxID=3459088 RepID=UPI00403FF7CC